MTNRWMSRKRVIGAMISGGLALAAALTGAPRYARNGDVTLPDYRKWVFLGSGLGMSYTGQTTENPPFTNVFAAPSAYDQYIKNGVWPDGTVLVAEHRASATNLSINKTGRAQVGPAAGIEMEVKDAAKGGWAFYAIEKGAATGKRFPKSAVCYECHEQHAAVDNTFVQFYPSLIEAAKAHGTYKEKD